MPQDVLSDGSQWQPIRLRWSGIEKHPSSSQIWPDGPHDSNCLLQDTPTRSHPPTQFLEMSDYSLTHLKQLEAESIHIIREVVSEFQKAGHALQHRQGLGSVGSSGPQSLLSRPSLLSL